MLRDLSTSLIVRGVLAAGIGIAAIVWPGITVGAVVLLFAVYAFLDALNQAMRAFMSERPGPVAGHLLLALLDVVAGVVAIAWPGITAYALVIWVGAWAITTGVVEVGVAFRPGAAAGGRAFWFIAGALSILFGAVAFAHPRAGALSLALVFGFFSLSVGVSEVALGLEARRTGDTISSVLHRAA